MTTTELLKEYQQETIGNLVPERASEILKDVSSLLGNVLDEITRTKVAYNKVLLGYLDVEKTANRAKIKADITQEYIEMESAKNAQVLANSIIQSMKYYLRSSEREYREMKNL